MASRLAKPNEGEEVLVASVERRNPRLVSLVRLLARIAAREHALAPDHPDKDKIND
jgi:hypothetical protein